MGQIVINEIMYDPSPPNSADSEWFELYNAGTDRVNLSGWTVKDDGSNTFTISGDLWIDATGYLVLGEKEMDNGGVTLDYVYPSSFALANTEDELILLDAEDPATEQDRVEYDERDSWPVGDGASIALRSTDDYANFNNNDPDNWCVASTAYGTGAKGTPGTANDCPIIPEPITAEIFVIQGSGAVSPQNLGQATTNNNIVTALVDASGTNNDGFLMQTPTARSDNDPNTSDGIFVVHTGSPTVAVGDQVDVVGTVEEYFGFTRIVATASGGSVTVDANNQALPAPVELNASRPSPDPTSPSCAIEWECYEGMRISVANGLVVTGSQYFGSDQVAEMYVVANSSRPFREPGVAYPGLAAYPDIPVWDGNPEVFELDPDKAGLENVSWTPGATFSAVGVLGYEFGGYELWATELSAGRSGVILPRPVRSKADDEITVASQNLLQLRANSSATKLAKLSRLIREVLGSPDIVAVQEAYGLAALQNLATRIESDDSSVTYTALLEAPGSALSVGFLVGSGVTVNSIAEHGRDETFIDPRDGSVDILHDRPPLVLEATVDDLDFSVVGVHNRSLIGIDHPTDGERNRIKRLQQAQSLARLVQSLQSSRVIVLGDYNAFEFTDGYVDVMGQISGDVRESENLLSGPDLVQPNLTNLIYRLPASERYSIFFEGSAQALDHALVNQNMASHVVEMQFARANADAAGIDRNDDTNALAASDHDGLVVYLATEALPPPETSDLVLTGRGRPRGSGYVYELQVRNRGPAIAPHVWVQHRLGVESGVSTSGCAEDSEGIPICTLGELAAGAVAAFAIEVDADAAGRSSLSYKGAVGTSGLDLNNHNDTVALAAPPKPPSELTAVALDPSRIRLEWLAGSLDRTGFVVFMRGPDTILREILSVGADRTSAVVEGLVPATTYAFSVAEVKDGSQSERTSEVSATTFVTAGDRCAEDDVLCLGRFQIEVDWETGEARSGRGQPEQLTTDSADFWFFDPTNIELVVKVLDGCAINGHHWVFAAGLTDVAVDLKVRDLQTGLEREWTSPLGTRFAPITETRAFATCPPAGTAEAGGSTGRDRPDDVSRVAADHLSDRIAALYQASAPGVELSAVTGSGCVPGDTALCLESGRFEVAATWTAGGEGGSAGGSLRTANTGLFWFFHPANIELIVKVLDGCALNDQYWVLMGGLTDVGVEVVVTDSTTGEAKRFESPEGTGFETRFDLAAFSCRRGP